MKPTFQISRPVRQREVHSTAGRSDKSPVLEWSYQPSGPVIRGGSSSAFQSTPERAPLSPRLWTLSQGFFEAEAKREYRFEAVLFGVIVALSAWPIGLAVQAAAHLMR